MDAVDATFARYRDQFRLTDGEGHTFCRPSGPTATKVDVLMAIT